jgi:GNAT superfamily N-acetyltransferase
MIEIRQGKEPDIPQVLELIRELAEYEKALDQVQNSEERMKEELFNQQNNFGFLVAEVNGQIVGTSIYYFRYSTWKGKRIYLEDLVVTAGERNKGIGKQLFEETIKIGKQNNCSGMMWQVLDWNESAIAFYKNYGTDFDEGWINCHLDF